MANPSNKALPAKILIENKTRDVYLFPIEKEEADPHRPGRVVTRVVGMLKIGDKADSDENVPEQGRDPDLQPDPVVTWGKDEMDAIGPSGRTFLKHLIDSGKLRITELAA